MVGGGEPRAARYLLIAVPPKGTIVPEMGTPTPNEPALAALFGKSRRAVLALLLGRPDESFYVREVVRAAGVGQGTVQRELEQLTRAGIVRRFTRGRQVYFQADADCPIFPELRGIVWKTVGLVDVLRKALDPLARQITLAFVYGSVARGEQRPGSDIDLCVIAKMSFAELVNALAPAQKTLAREINPTVYPANEFRRKLASNHHFISRIAEGPKLFIVGDEREFARLGE